MSVATHAWGQSAPKTGADATGLWLCALEDSFDPGQLEIYAQMLDDEERARWQRFRFERDRRVFLLSHALLRSVLALYVGSAPSTLRFERGEHGKPRLIDPRAPSFNLSHSRDRALLAVCPAGFEVGVDIEYERDGRRFEALARRNFAAPEIARLEATTPEERSRDFYRFWTLKEAYVKARATGLTLALDGFWFTWREADASLHLEARTDVDRDPQRWHACGFQLAGGYAAALVRERPAGAAPVPRWFEARPLESWRAVDVAPFAASAT